MHLYLYLKITAPIPPLSGHFVFVLNFFFHFFSGLGYKSRQECGRYYSVSDMLSTVHDLKVDQTVLTSDEIFIFISNINIPVGHFNQLESIIQRVYNFIDGEYHSCPVVQYQVTSTYELRNIVDDSIRQWTGSFSPRNNLPGSITQFEYFDASFVERLTVATDLNSIVQKLKFTNANTNYVFERLTSIIVNVQAAVSGTFPTLVRRNLVYTRNVRHFRNHITIPLP